MIISFKTTFPWGTPTKFKEKIKDGIKIHSIIEDPHLRWKPGMKIQMATGARTKDYNCFNNKKECVSIQSIKKNTYRDRGIIMRIEIIIDGNLFYSQEGYSSYGTENLDLLAKNEGLDSPNDFSRYFSECFEGRIIHFSEFKY
jgi:hypothetical protein